jgi:hypothetical protein
VLAASYGATLFVSHADLRPSLSTAARTLVALAVAFAVALTLPVSSALAALGGSLVLAVGILMLGLFPRELIEALRPRAPHGGTR